MSNTTATTTAHLTDLATELGWLKALITARIAHANEQQSILWEGALANPPQLDAGSAYGNFVNSNKLNVAERLALILALAPYLQPNLLAQLYMEGNAAGLARSPKTLRFAPSADTLWYLLQLPDTLTHLEHTHLFGANHLFYKKGVLFLGDPESGFAVYSGLLNLHAPYRELFLTNKPIQPRYSKEFPAKLLTTPLEWDDLLLPERTLHQLAEITTFHQQEAHLRQDPVLNKHLKAGYRAMFSGPSGVGKTLAAALLAKRMGLPIYRVDISQLVSKYIGETSQNLDKLFNLAEDQGWILFFDEGDALFGKRIDTGENDHKNAHYANQEVAYLLQRIEDYNGFVFVATNKPNNMDSAFGRRFQNKVAFETLPADACIALWEQLLTREFTLGPDVNLMALNKLHHFTVANIYNVLARVTMLCRAQSLTAIPYDLLRRCALDEKVK